MPEPVNWGVDPSIADPSSPNYDPDHISHSEEDFNIAQLMLDSRAKELGLFPQNVTATEGSNIQILPMKKGIICFISAAGPLNEITVETQPLSVVRDALPFTICARCDVNNVIWTGIPMENGPTSFVHGDSYSFRYYAAGGMFIKTASSL